MVESSILGGTSWVVFPGPFDGAPLPGGLTAAPHHGIAHSADPLVNDWLAKIDTFYARETSQALQAFDAQRDADGNTLLDNTVATYVSEGDALTHDESNVPFLVFGGKNTRIAGGTFIKATGGPLHSTPDGTPSGNRPTNDVWLALAPIFGVPLDGLGAPTQFTGPLPGLVV